MGYRALLHRLVGTVRMGPICCSTASPGQSTDRQKLHMKPRHLKRRPTRVAVTPVRSSMPMRVRLRTGQTRAPLARIPRIELRLCARWFVRWSTASRWSKWATGAKPETWGRTVGGGGLRATKRTDAALIQGRTRMGLLIENGTVVTAEKTFAEAPLLRDDPREARAGLSPAGHTVAVDASGL